jgi:hypothetical protein
MLIVYRYILVTLSQRSQKLQQRKSTIRSKIPTAIITQMKAKSQPRTYAAEVGKIFALKCRQASLHFKLKFLKHRCHIRKESSSIAKHFYRNTTFKKRKSKHCSGQSRGRAKRLHIKNAAKKTKREANWRFNAWPAAGAQWSNCIGMRGWAGACDCLRNGGETYGARLLPIACMSARESSSACGTPFTKARKEEGSADARNSSAWPVEARVEV